MTEELGSIITRLEKMGITAARQPNKQRNHTIAMEAFDSLEEYVGEMEKLRGRMAQGLGGCYWLKHRISRAWSWLSGKPYQGPDIGDLLAEYAGMARSASGQMQKLQEQLTIDRDELGSFKIALIQRHGSIASDITTGKQMYNETRKNYDDTSGALAEAPRNHPDHTKLWIAEANLRQDLADIQQELVRGADRLHFTFARIGVVQRRVDQVQAAVNYTTLAVQRTTDVLELIDKLKPSMETYASITRLARGLGMHMRTLKEYVGSVFDLFGRSTSALAEMYTADTTRSPSSDLGREVLSGTDHVRLPAMAEVRMFARCEEQLRGCGLPYQTLPRIGTEEG